MPCTEGFDRQAPAAEDGDTLRAWTLEVLAQIAEECDDLEQSPQQRVASA